MSIVDEARAVRQRIADRLAELEPLVREYNDLVKLAEEMGVDQEPQQIAAAGRRRPASGPRSQRRGGRSAGKGRSATAGNRVGDDTAEGNAGDDVAAVVLEAVRAEPGKTVADYAEALNLSATALYRPVRQLTDQGVLVKRSRQLFPA